MNLWRLRAALILQLLSLSDTLAFKVRITHMHAHTRTHSVNSEDQGPVGFSSECTVHIKQSRLQPLLSSVCSSYCCLISFKQKTWHLHVVLSVSSLNVHFLPATVTEVKWGFVPQLIINVTYSGCIEGPENFSFLTFIVLCEWTKLFFVYIDIFPIEFMLQS